MLAESDALFKLTCVYHMVRNIFHSHVFSRYRVSDDVCARTRFNTDRQKSKFSCPGADFGASRGSATETTPSLYRSGRRVVVSGGRLELHAIGASPRACAAALVAARAPKRTTTISWSI